MKRRLRHIAVASLSVALAATCAMTAGPGWPVPPARAQDAGASFMNPFPENDVWKGIVIGDNLAEGLAAGLIDAMTGETRLQLQRARRNLPALSRNEIEEDARQIEDLVTRDKIHIAVIWVGMQDRQGIRLPNGRRLAVNQGDWRALYGARVDRLVRGLRRKGVAVYWVGLPIMRRPEWNEDIEHINEVMRDRAVGAGGRYIDAFKETADENGRFSDRGPDLQGKMVRLRDPEGYDFTPSGYRRLAFAIERQLKRDMTAAREERTISLAGSEAEQKRINPDATRIAADSAAAAAKGAAAKDARAAASPVTQALTPGATQPTTPGASGSDLKADNVRVSFRIAGAGGREEQVTIEIVRPALTQSVIQLMTRRDKGDKPSQVGDTLVDTLSNGLLVMRSVTPSQRTAERAGQRTSLTQQPFFIALSKGERLPPKPGRADDFRWPREDDIPPPPQVSAAAGAPIASPVPLGSQPPPSRQRVGPRPRPQRTQQAPAPAPAPGPSIFQQ